MRFSNPGAYLIGAQKSGTTSLASLLAQHPAICLPKLKEPGFFSHNWDKGFEWYLAQFPELGSRIRLDATTNYSMAPLSEQTLAAYPDHPSLRVPERVARVDPGARFIYLLRDPVERTYSSYWHNVRTGREQRSFAEAVRAEPYYRDVSDYDAQLERWLVHFPLESFHFVLSERFRDDPVAVARECLDFLGLDCETIALQAGQAQNVSHDLPAWARKLRWIARQRPNWARPWLALASHLPGRARQAVRAVGRERVAPMPALPESERPYLVDYFRERNRRLAERTGLRLDFWQG